jgi:hypothetical protein
MQTCTLPIGFTMEILLPFRNIKDDFPDEESTTGMYSVLSIEKCEKYRCFSACCYQLNVLWMMRTLLELRGHTVA